MLAQKCARPFPQHVQYATGVIKPDHISQQQMDDSVAAFYKRWKGQYVKDDVGSGQFYIWTENSTGNKKCVSEGQGYGMMIVAIMAGYDTAAKEIYDGLFRYYTAHPSNKNKYLMAWAQNSNFKNADGSSATDGDMDIAYSLLLADKQWGSNNAINYKNEADSMLAAIMLQEINPVTFSILISNAIESDSKDYFDMRSSDFMPAHYKVFAAETKDDRWNKVIDQNYQIFNSLQKKYSANAGLVPDFIQHIHSKPAPAVPDYLESKYDGFYNYNACRVPWRIATDYILNGDQRSKIFTEKINNWIKETTSYKPDNISAGYTLAGNDIKGRYFEAMSFIASFAVAAMIDNKNQEWLNKLWDYIESFNINQYDYYDNSIKMISLILLSGNYWSVVAK